MVANNKVEKLRRRYIKPSQEEYENVEIEYDDNSEDRSEMGSYEPVPVYRQVSNGGDEYRRADMFADGTTEDLVDSRDEIEESLAQFKYSLQSPSPSLSDGEYTEPVTLSENGINDEATIEGKKFGFIRNKWDDFRDTMKVKSEARKAAYEKYLESRPKVLQERYEKEYAEKLAKEGMTPGERIDELKSKDFTSGLKKVSGMLGGKVHPSKVMGMSGTVLGPLPGYRDYEQPKNMQSRKEVNMSPYYRPPGARGSQQPKYLSAPSGSDPDTTWTRVVKYDKYGKKRSYLRKSRIPEQQQQQEEMIQPQPQLIGGYNLSALGTLSQPAPMQTNPMEKVLGFMGMGMGRNNEQQKINSMISLENKSKNKMSEQQRILNMFKWG